MGHKPTGSSTIYSCAEIIEFLNICGWSSKQPGSYNLADYNRI